jgi:hypothetical protein
MDKSLGKLRQIGTSVIYSALIVFFIGVMVWGVKGIFSTANSPRPEVVKSVVQPMEIAVTSQTVKSVGGKYRYFFDIRNNSEKSFAGDVRVDLVNAEGDVVYGDTFTTNQPIAPGLGTSVYIDANTGPTSVHGVNGIQTYTYEAKVNGQVVKTGTGTIQPLSQ